MEHFDARRIIQDARRSVSYTLKLLPVLRTSAAAARSSISSHRIAIEETLRFLRKHDTRAMFRVDLFEVEDPSGS